VVHQVGLQLFLVLHDNGDILMVRTQLSAILDLSFYPVKKIVPSVKKIICFGLDGLLLVRKGFSKAARVAFSADMFLKIKKFLYLMSYQRCSAFK
jgi:hypothetical protein